LPRHARADAHPYPRHTDADRAAARHAHADRDPHATYRDACAVHADAQANGDGTASNANHNAIPHPLADQHPNACVI